MTGPQQSRRRFLAGLGSAIVASAATEPVNGSVTEQTPTTWPSFHADSRNSGHQPGGRGPVDGAGVRWRVRSVNGFGPPVCDGDRVYVGSANGEMYAFDTTTGKIAWRHPMGAGIDGTPALANGSVYVASAGRLYSLDPVDGSISWMFHRNSAGELVGANTGPTVDNGTIYAGTGYEQLAAVSTADGQLQWTAATTGGEDEIEGSPAVGNDNVYVSTSGGNVFAFNKADGSKQWQRTTDSRMDAAPVVVDGTVYVGSGPSGGDTLYALNTEDGRTQWRQDFESAVRTPAVTGQRVYAGTASGTVVALSVSDGSDVWRSSLGIDGGATSPVVVGDTLYVGGGSRNAGAVLALDPANGTEQWRVKTSGVAHTPAAVDGALFVGTGTRRGFGTTIRLDAESAGSTPIARAVDQVTPSGTTSGSGTDTTAQSTTTVSRQSGANTRNTTTAAPRVTSSGKPTVWTYDAVSALPGLLFGGLLGVGSYEAYDRMRGTDGDETR